MQMLQLALALLLLPLHVAHVILVGALLSREAIVLPECTEGGDLCDWITSLGVVHSVIPPSNALEG